MLGRLGMSVDAAIQAYRAVGQKAFTPKRYFSLPAPPKGRYSAMALEGAIKKVVREQCQDDACAGASDKSGTCRHEEKLFREPTTCKTVALAITKDNIDARPTLFKTYDDSDGFANCTIWEVARATSAATTFFKSIKCGRDDIEFIDTGFGYNNPCEVLIDEARSLFPEAPEILVLSIGTGLGDKVEIKDSRASILTALKKMASESNKVANRLKDAHTGKANYFRFNVDRGLQDVTLADWEKSSKILGHTLNYVNNQKFELAQCAKALSAVAQPALPIRTGELEQGQGHVANGQVRSELEAQGPSQDGPVRSELEAQRDVPSIDTAGNQSRLSASAQRSRSQIFDIPLDTNKNYVERADLIKQLDNYLRPTDSGRSASRAALIGLGGSGKTELATKFAEAHRQDYSAVFWVNATDAVQLVGGFSRIARLLGLGTGISSEGTMDLVREWLINNSGYLLIIDNVDEDAMLDQLHRNFLGAGMSGAILITGRNESIRTRCNAVEVSDMALDEALMLFGNITGSKVSSTAAGALLEGLGYLPLAIDQAATFMSETKYSIEEYWKLFESERSFLLKKHPSTQYNVNGRQSVMTTWEISFKRLERDHPEAANLLFMFSLMHHEGIPYGILKNCLGGEKYFQGSGEYGLVAENERWIPDCLGNALRRESSFVDEIAALQKYSFARSMTSSLALHVHPLVHFWPSQHLQSDEPLRIKLACCVLGLLGSAFEKQDRLPPLCSRTHDSRGLEEAKMGIWPLRRYTQYAAQALHCLKHASALLSTMPQTVNHLVLCLLQVFEYASYRDFDADQDFIFDLLEGAGRVEAKDDSGFFEWSILTWRLVRADLCKCRKDMGMIRKQATKGRFCTRCRETFMQVAERLGSFVTSRNDPVPRTPLAVCVVDCLVFRLASDGFWKYWARGQTPAWEAFWKDQDHSAEGEPAKFADWPDLSISDVKAPLDRFLRKISEKDMGSDELRRLVAESTWVESYGLCTRYYLLIRSEGEYCYGSSHIPTRILLDDHEPMEVASSCASLCGVLSEEHRRAAFYATVKLFQDGSWANIENYLRPFVFRSMEQPSSSWSHERCIIRSIDALIRQDKEDQAEQMLSRVIKSYAGAGKRLLSIEKSQLLRSADEIRGLCPSGLCLRLGSACLTDFTLPQSKPEMPVKRNIQIFINTFGGKTFTIKTDTCATVRSVMDSFDDGGGDVSWGERRLIYGGKQLEADRFL